jgi:SAM-dependent methyltransferase
LPFFIEFLKVSGVFEAWVADCPLAYQSNHASDKRAVLATLLLSILAGHHRYAHITAIRYDGIHPELLGVSRLVSEDAARRALTRIDESSGVAWLDRHLGPGDSVLDYGCGSGILAIAAGRLGAGTLVGVDVDDQALSAARANSAANGVSARYTDPAGLGIAQFDIVVANILSSPLKLLAPALLARVAPAGALVLSGVLERQAAEVIAAYREAQPGIALAVAEVCDGWVCLTGWRHA